MDVLNSLFTQLRNLWNRTSVTGRVATGTAVSMVVTTVVGVAIWSSRPDYKPLREGISPRLTAEIKSVLDANGIPNRMNYSGSGVLVPTSRWNEANVAIADLGIPDMDAVPDAGGMFLPGKPGHQDTLRIKEQALVRSLESLRAVKSADVHLAVPEPSPFRTNRQPASASVVIEPQPNHTISREMAMSIIQMVASAVEGLDPKNVTLANTGGTLYGGLANDDPAVNRRELVRELEVSLAMKAQDVLGATLGPDRAVVRVTADVDSFVDKVITKNSIEAAAKVRLQERLETTDQQGMPLTSGGPAGTSSNGSGASLSSASPTQVVGKTETNETTYDYPRTTERTHVVGGQPVRLSVSATVDVTPDNAGGANGVSQPLLTQQQVEGMIKSAIGFDEKRGDQIQVVLAEISDAPLTSILAPVPDTQKWQFFGELARNASLGLAAVVALLIGVMTLKKLQPIEMTSSREDQRQRELLTELSSRIDQNPEAVSKILASWLGRDADQASGDDAPFMRRAA